MALNRFNEPVAGEAYWCKVGDEMICWRLMPEEIDRKNKTAAVCGKVISFRDIRGLETEEYEPCMLTESKRAREEALCWS